ncbi:hypothetical protein ABIF65_010288 [Bradyrhizobium japonicum]
MAHKKLVNQSGLLLTVLLITRVGSEPNQSVTTRGSSWDNVLTRLIRERAPERLASVV